MLTPIIAIAATLAGYAVGASLMLRLLIPYQEPCPMPTIHDHTAPTTAELNTTINLEALL